MLSLKLPRKRASLVSGKNDQVLKELDHLLQVVQALQVAPNALLICRVLFSLHATNGGWIR